MIEEMKESIPLTRKEAAEALGAAGFEISAGTLANLAAKNTGPRFTLFRGWAQYTVDDLLEWAEARGRDKFRRGRPRIPDADGVRLDILATAQTLEGAGFKLTSMDLAKLFQKGSGPPAIMQGDLTLVYDRAAALKWARNMPKEFWDMIQ